MLDVGLGDEGEDAVSGLQQSGVAPTLVVVATVVVRPLRRLLARCGQGVEILVAVCPVLYPAACALGDAEGGELLWQSTLHVGEVIAEGDAVVVEAQHQLNAPSEGGCVFIAGIGAVAPFACRHLIILCDGTDELEFRAFRGALYADGGDVQDMVSTIGDCQPRLASSHGHFAVGRLLGEGCGRCCGA